MTPKEKAIELVEKFKDFVHGYIGSSMLTNTEYPEQILSQAKKCALIAVEELIIESDQYEFEHPILIDKRKQYWNEVKQELEKL